MVYITIIVFLLFLLFHFDICGNKKNRLFWYNATLVIFILLAGLRYHVGADTYAYVYKYYYANKEIANFTTDDFQIGKDPFFYLITSICYTFGTKFYVVQIIQATIVNVLLFNYIKRHSRYIFTCVFFYYITFYFLFNMEVMRGSISVVICLYGNDYLRKGLWLKGYLLYLVAFFFHVQTLILFFMPLLLFLRWNKTGFLFLLGTYVAFYFIQQYIGDYLLLVDISGEVNRKAVGYSDLNSSYIGSNFNILGVLVTFFKTLFYVVLAMCYFKNNKLFDSLEQIEPFIMIGLFFHIISFNISIAYRLESYYSIYFVMLFADFFILVARKIDIKKTVSKLIYSIIVFSPMFLAITIGYMHQETRVRYFPYTSIFDKTEVPERNNFLEYIPIDKKEY